jgi:hypothetical protein
MHGFSSRPPICDMTNIHRSAGENRQKSLFFSHVYPHTSMDIRRVANRRPRAESMHKIASFRIHYFVV